VAHGEIIKNPLSKERAMKSSIPAAAALALFALAGTASAQTSPPQTAAAPAAMAGPTHPAGRYRGVDSDGRKVDVQAPMGGNSQAQADKIEAPITERLNEQALMAAQPH